MLVHYIKRYCHSRAKIFRIIIMTPDGYKEKGILPKEGSVIWSPHESIFKRGFPYVYKVLKVRKKQGRLLLTVKVIAPSKKVVFESRDVYFDEID